MDNESKQPIFPYVSYPAFKTFIGHLHDTVVTDQIDNTMMPPKMSGGARSAVTSALKSLGLIDDQNNTTSELKEIVDAYNNKEWPEVLKKYILSAYHNVAKPIDLKSATRKQLENMFEDASPQMKDKYIRFFLSANKDAGIEYSPHLKIRRRKTKRRSETSTSKGEVSTPKKNEQQEKQVRDKTPPDMFDLPIPIATGSFIRVPRNIKVNQVNLVEAAVGYLKAMAEQNQGSQ